MLICSQLRHFFSVLFFISFTLSQPLYNSTYTKTTSNPQNEALEQRFPGAIIIGVKKCGTRALLEFLKLNEHVRAPGPEVHFFDKNFDKGYDWYRLVILIIWVIHHLNSQNKCQ